jgi:hypothetical protein
MRSLPPRAFNARWLDRIISFLGWRCKISLYLEVILLLLNLVGDRLILTRMNFELFFKITLSWGSFWLKLCVFERADLFTLLTFKSTEVFITCIGTRNQRSDLLLLDASSCGKSLLDFIGLGGDPEPIRLALTAQRPLQTMPLTLLLGPRYLTQRLLLIFQRL